MNVDNAHSMPIDITRLILCNSNISSELWKVIPLSTKIKKIYICILVIPITIKLLSIIIIIIIIDAELLSHYHYSIFFEE